MCRTRGDRRVELIIKRGRVREIFSQSVEDAIEIKRASIGF